jgi:drug/metabolite transporter (DMT)-like permease
MVKYHKSVTITFAECFIYIAQAIVYYAYLKYKKIEYSKKDDKAEKLMKIYVSLRALFIAFATANIGLISYFARIAGISPSVCISLTVLTSFTSAVVFKMRYKEVLNSHHWLGMVAIVISVIIIGFSKSQNTDLQGNELEHSFLLKIVPIGLSFVSVVVYTISGLLSREAMTIGYRKIKFAVDLVGLAGLLFLVAFIYN